MSDKELTEKQKLILEYLLNGKSIIEISKEIKTSRQAVYMIVNRLKKLRVISKRINPNNIHKIYQKNCYFCDFDIILEEYHIKFKSKNGNNSKNNLINLCPNHHKMIHYGDYYLDSINKEFVLRHRKYGNIFIYKYQRGL